MPRRSRKPSFTKAVEGRKLEIWRSYIASGGRIGEVAAKYQLTPEEVEGIVKEVEDFFHAPLADPEKLMNQINLLNETASRAEFICYEIVEHYYSRWKNGEFEEPPQPLLHSLEKWHSLTMERLKIQLKFLQNLQKHLSHLKEEESERSYLSQLIADDEEDEEE